MGEVPRRHPAIRKAVCTSFDFATLEIYIGGERWLKDKTTERQSMTSLRHCRYYHFLHSLPILHHLGRHHLRETALFPAPLAWM